MDRSHRKLAHRGSYLERVYVSPSTVDRVLAAHGLVLPGRQRPAPRVRRPWPAWVEYRPNQVWGWDATHFTRCRRAPCCFGIVDLVSRKWVATLLCAEESTTQARVLFLDALEAEGLLAGVEERFVRPDALVAVDLDDERIPILLAVSDNGAAMTAHSTREFMALCSIAQHFGRPGVPTDQAHIETQRFDPRRPMRCSRCRRSSEWGCRRDRRMSWCASCSAISSGPSPMPKQTASVTASTPPCTGGCTRVDTPAGLFIKSPEIAAG